MFSGSQEGESVLWKCGSHLMNHLWLDDMILTGECISLRAAEGVIAAALLPPVLGKRILVLLQL